jgi:ribosomal protein S18 acetylase RimI-like enzyme
VAVTVTSSEKYSPEIAAQVRPLLEADLPALRRSWNGRSDLDEVRRILQSCPGRSVWLPDTLEFVLVGPWRHRDEIAQIIEFSAVRHPLELLDAAAAQCKERGAHLLVFLELDDVRHPGFWHKAGFHLLEEVIAYELDRIPPAVGWGERLRFELLNLHDETALASLVALDHAAFPWIWWNSEVEFLTYGLSPGVEIFLAYAGTELVGYIGMTSYLGWGHLDRIAIHPRYQGRGLGREALTFAVQRLAQAGARRVGLSTQLTNRRSQRLYERFGFRRSRSSDYRLVGRWLRRPEPMDITLDEEAAKRLDAG